MLPLKCTNNYYGDEIILQILNVNHQTSLPTATWTPHKLKQTSYWIRNKVGFLVMQPKTKIVNNKRDLQVNKNNYSE